MEGYTNVIGGQYDFDDLDIEGRVVDEWNAEDEEKGPSRLTDNKNIDERTFLSKQVKLDNGQQGDVFSVLRRMEHSWYTCNVCGDTLVGLAALGSHCDSGKHRANMSKPSHPRAKFIKLDPKENLSLEPGEPVPPGLEEVMFQSCLIQPKLDAYHSPLIGLEFLVELTQCSVEEGTLYYCLLCDKTGAERNMFIHLTSMFHYMKYLSIYFPSVARKLHGLPNRKLKKAFGLLVTEIVGDIEAKFGRLKPHSETHAGFYTGGRKSELNKTVTAGPHFRETDCDENFADKATPENVDRKSKELQAAPPATTKMEIKDLDISKDGSLFNKNRINVDKKQLRTRDENLPDRKSSPDLQIIDVQMPKIPDKRKRTRSRSLSSISTLSSVSSKSHHHSHSRHRSKLSNHSRHRNRSRSRSRSPYQYRRRRSPSYRRYSPSHRSPDNRRRNYSRNHSPDQYRHKGTDRYGRSRESSRHENKDKYSREKPDEKPSLDNSERLRWEQFREELKKIESVKLEKLKFHEKNPEKHPQYPEEWKSFWNRRYNELQRSGIDPAKHDFKPEWISFWTKRMKELYEEDLSNAKEELKTKFDLPEDMQEKAAPWKNNSRKRSPGLVDISPPTPDKKDAINNIKSTWKAFTGSDIKDAPKRPLSPWEEDSYPSARKDGRKYSPRSRSQSPNLTEKLLEDMPQRKTRTSSLIFVLRKLTVLEQQLGSLAPKVFELLSQSLALEKVKEDASLDLLMDVENSVFLETVREKLIALLCAGVVPRNFVNTARSAIKHIDIALYLATKRERAVPRPYLSNTAPYSSAPPLPAPDPVVVPGVGQVDKVAIAQQIATALVMQGKTNVTEAELEQLINAVVGMAEASANSSQPMTTANFLQHLQSAQSAASSTPAPTPIFPIRDTVTPSSTALSSQASGSLNDAQPPASQEQQFGALKLLQSAYNDSAKQEQDSPKPDIVEVSDSKSSSISDHELAAALSAFNKTSKEEQPGYIQKLKSTNPDMYKRLGPFIGVLETNEPAKRSPITIPISKERSEQKIKPLASGRLSPFSLRSGGANPSHTEEVEIVEENKEQTNVTRSKPQDHKNIPKFNVSDDDEEDDDDDDYSFEDLYKAAQETLRQKQLVEDGKRQKQLVEDGKDNQPTSKEDKNSNKTTEHDNKESNQADNNSPPALSSSANQASSQESLQSLQTPQNQSLKQPPQPSFPISTQQTFQPSAQQSLAAPVQQAYSAHPTTHQPAQASMQQQPYQSYDRYNQVQSQANLSNPYNSSSGSSYHDAMQKKSLPYDGLSQQSYNSGSLQNEGNDYPNESMYSNTNADYYDNNRPYSNDLMYSSAKETYNSGREYASANESYSSNAQRYPYTSSYSAQGNPGYGSQGGSYDDQYNRYRGATPYVRESYPQAHNPSPSLSRTPQRAYPNSSIPPQRYPDQNYPHY